MYASTIISSCTSLQPVSTYDPLLHHPDLRRPLEAGHWVVKATVVPVWLYCTVLYCTVLWYLPHTLPPSLVHIGDVDQVLGQLGGTWATHPVIEHTWHCIKAYSIVKLNPYCDLYLL